MADNPSRRLLLAQGAAASVFGALSSAALASAPGAHPDAELIRLGVRLDAAHEKLCADSLLGDYPDDYEDPELAVAHEIIQVLAVTTVGLAIKAKALFYLTDLRDELWGRPDEWDL